LEAAVWGLLWLGWVGCGSPGVDAHPSCDGRGFSMSAQSWSIPDYGPGALDLPSAASTCDTQPWYQPADLDGDGRLDLVVTYDCAGGEVGDARWDVHRNTGDGFAAEATPWPLPPEFSAGQLARLFGYACIDGPLYQVIDLDGDGRGELVVTSRCDDGPVGTSRWDVYDNTGDGFTATPRAWALPVGFPDGTFFQPSWGSCGYGAERAYSTTDLTGDGRPDLVVTYGCEAGPIGQRRWDVYENTGDGFASTPLAWALPEGYGDEGPFWLTSVQACTGAQAALFATADVDADARPDLVVTYRCEAGPVGSDHWLVYRNTGAGFSADASQWALPPIGDVATVGNASCVGDAPLYSLANLDGQGPPDLVVTYDCAGADANLGTSRWDAYLGGEAGFASAPVAWALPTEYPATSFASLAGYSCSTSGAPLYTTLDLDSDGALDLVVTGDCTAASLPEWRRYAGTCE
jgi:hypothetical protein